MAWSTPPTFVSGATLTAAQLNILSGDLTVVGGATASYTPTFTNITKGNAVLNFGYVQTNKRVWVRGLFQAGTTTSYSSGNLGISLPTTAYTGVANNDWGVGVGIASFTSGATRYAITAVITSSGILNFIVDNSAGNAVTNLVPSTFGNQSAISFTVEYETT
jgi:hypothetical protein